VVVLSQETNADSAEALAKANQAITTSNAANTKSDAAVATANTSLSQSSTALSNSTAAVNTANSANTKSDAAVATANAANAKADAAVSTANAANAKADTAINAVASAVTYTPVTNVAGIPSSPANNTYIEVFNSTGIESFTPLAGRPAGFVGGSGLAVRLRYTTSPATWNWMSYYATDSETRYLKLAGGTLTGALAHPLGAAATPSITFTGDTNTGIYSPGADTLAFTEGGIERMRITTGGSVGIGTASPGSTLQVVGEISSGAAGTNGSISLRRTSDGASINSILYDSATEEMRLNNGSGNGRIVFQTVSTERARIDSSGRLLVGTSAALDGSTSPLQIKASSTLIVGQTTGDAGDIARFDNSAYGPALFLRKSRSSTIGTHAVVQNGDDLGGLQFFGSNGTNFSGAGNIRCVADGTPGTTSMPGRLVFATTPSGATYTLERMRIDSNGKLLVGTPSVYDAQVGIASGNGWVYRTYSFTNGQSRTVTVSAGFNYWAEITLTLVGNADIAQAKTILGRRDINAHRSATANVIGSVITQAVSSSDAGEVRTWTVTYNHSTDPGNKNWMFEVKSLGTDTVSVA